jgi:PAS domain S-box-containing protein
MEGKNIRILLVEDNPDDLELFLRKLKNSVKVQLTVTPVKSLNKALDLISQEKPDIILSDLGLPDSHGLDTVTKIICAAPNIPLVVLSGFDDEETAIKAVQSGAQDYLVKGKLEGRDVERSLFYAIERARLQAELEQHTQEIYAIQANLLHVLQKNTDAIIVIGEDRHILFINPAAESLLGSSEKELLNEPFPYILYPGKTNEVVIKKSASLTRFAETNVVEIDWEGQHAFLVSMHDITARKRNEQALKESEAKFAKAFHSNANLIGINRLKDGVFIEINDSFTRITGYSREEVIGHNANELNLWASQEDKDRITNKTRENESLSNEQIKFRDKSGEIHYGLFSSDQITIGGEKCFIHTITDITELIRAEESLKISEEKFSKAFRHSPEAYVITKLDDGTILEVNDTFSRLTGYSHEEVVNRKSLELGLWANPEERIETVTTLQEKGIISDKEFHIRMKSGEIRIWLFSAEMIRISNTLCMLSMTTDITDRKKLEEKLRFSDTALNSIHEGIYAMDAEYKITRWNDICEQISGIKASEAIGKTVGEVFEMVEEYPGQNEERIKVLFEKGFNKEEQIYRTPRGNIWVDVHAQAITDNGKVQGWVTLLSDITERKKAEEALRFSHAAFQSIHESVIATDTNHVITHWNEISEEIYGIKASDAIGKKIYDIIEFGGNLPGDQERYIQNLEAEGYLHQEALHRTKHGEVWVDVTVQPIEENDKRYGWVMLATAITQRKLAEEMLKRSEEKYRELISVSNDGIVSNDAHMRITIWNQGAEKIFGYTEKEMLGQPVTKFLPESEHKKALQLHNGFIKTSPEKTTGKSLEGFGLKKDGQKIPIELSISSKRYGDNFIATAIIRDITERKEAEEKLRKSEERYRDLFENASELIQSVSQEGRFLYVNKAWREALGYGEKEIAKLNLWDVIHPDYQVHCREVFSKVMEGDSIHIETVFVAKDGRAIHVEGNANNYYHESHLTATRGIFQDITERWEAEERLRESEERYRDLFENANDFIQSCGNNHRFAYVNKAWREALGYSQKEIANLILWDIVHPDYVENCKKTFRTVMTGKPVNNVETVFVTKEGKYIYVEGNVSAVFKDGQAVATRAIFRDITERKEAEEKLRKIDKMKSEFLSNVSHELRTPLQSISGFTKLILNGQVPDQATQQEFLGIIDNETVHLGNLINSLLDMSRLESGRFQINKTLIPIRDTIVDSVKSFHTMAREKNISLSEDIPEDLPQIEADGARLRQVFINLLSNAIKYSDPGAKVKITAEKSQGELLVKISDSGIGMTPEVQKHLFERFFRAEDKLARGGAGLGLYITKQIVDAHGGKIRVESKPNEGSTFSVTIPFNYKGGDNHDQENTRDRRRSSHIKVS